MTSILENLDDRVRRLEGASPGGGPPVTLSYLPLSPNAIPYIRTAHHLTPTGTTLTVTGGGGAIDVAGTAAAVQEDNLTAVQWTTAASGASAGLIGDAYEIRTRFNPTISFIFTMSTVSTRFFAGVSSSTIHVYGAATQAAFLRYDPPSGDSLVGTGFRVVVNTSGGAYSPVENQVITPEAGAVYRFTMEFSNAGGRMRAWLSKNNADFVLLSDTTSAQLPANNTGLRTCAYIRNPGDVVSRNMRLQTVGWAIP